MPVEVIKETSTVKNLTTTHVKTEVDKEYRISSFLSRPANGKMAELWETHVFPIDENGDVDYGDVLSVKDPNMYAALETHKMIIQHFDTYQKNFRRLTTTANPIV